MIHPDLETLIRYRDRELTERYTGTIKAYLKDCARCRLDLDMFQTALDEVRIESAPAPNPELLQGLRAAMRQWSADEAKPEQSGEALKSRVSGEIVPFLGRQGARMLLRTVPENGQNLLGTIERVLGNFLGERAAANLVSHVVDTTIVTHNL